MNYSEWQDTADTLRLFLQMAGKVKVKRSNRRPEWAHVRLYLQTDGFTTGLIPGDSAPFSIFFDFRQHRVEFRNGEGKRVDVPLQDGLTVADFYRQFTTALEQIGSPTNIGVVPQKVQDPIDFDKDKKHHSYDIVAIRAWLQNLLFAHGAMSRYLAAFNGKVHSPAYYFGSMDLSCMMYGGQAVPWGKKDAILQYAFDEQMYQCGFWAGDIHFPQAAFFAMPYPFVEDLKGNAGMLQPEKAFFKPQEKEFFLTLEDALSYPDPQSAVARFFRSGFDITQQLTPWDHLDRLLYQQV